MAELAGDGRLRELAGSLAVVRDRINLACQAASRSPEEVTLIAVTKFFPSDDVRRLRQLGINDFGESRHQEAVQKAADLPTAHWHFIGRLQRNKLRGITQYVTMVHSLDREDLALALDRAVEQSRPPDSGMLPVLLQVSLDNDPSRGGVSPSHLEALADLVVTCRFLSLNGLMAIPPVGANPEQAYQRLREIANKLQQSHPNATTISAGMSSDLAAAIKHGATHVRVGTALLGRRPLIVG